MLILKKETWTGLSQKFINWNWVFVFTLVTIGIVFVIPTTIALFFHEREIIGKLTPNSPTIKFIPNSPTILYNLILPFIEKIGYVILSAGFFAAFLKSFQFIGIFKEEMKKVISEEKIMTPGEFIKSVQSEQFIGTFKEHIKKVIVEEKLLTPGEFIKSVKSEEILIHSKNELHNILHSKDSLNYANREFREKIWKNVTYSLYDPSYPEIDEELVNKLLKFYVPSKLDYIQKNFIVEYDIQMKDAHHVNIIQNLSYDIIPGVEDINLIKSYFVWKGKEADDQGNVEILSYKINGEEHKHEFISEIIDKESYNVLKCTFKKELPPKKSSVKSKVLVTHSTRIPPYWRWELGRFTKGFQIRVNHDPKEMNVNLELTDERLDLKDVLLSLPKLYQKTDEVLLPSDGYIIIIDPK